ncbi:MAG: DNA repair protein RadC [Kiritimatiellaeota bacterium]|nr:DNA repair protein RadC [Kiritimatiellota bacterium]
MSHSPEKENVHLGHRDRLRARFLEEGLDGFEDHQVLELLLFQAIPRGDTNPIAHRLIKRFGSFAAVLEADPTDLATVEGVGQRAAAFLSMIPAVTRRYFHDRVAQDRSQLTDSEAVAGYVVPLMAGRSEEVFYVLCLDTHCRVLYAALVGKGTVKDAHVHPRHVVEAALRHRASSVVLAHNHPTGTAKPSKHDYRLTEILARALGPLEIRILDHIIVAGEDWYSFARNGDLHGTVSEGVGQ